MEVFREPEKGRFRYEERARPGDVLRPAELPSVEVPVEAILG